MIVVAVLGILAAIAFPEFQNHTQQAKEAAAKDNLRILREAIERYALDHNGIPPGYYDDNPLNGFHTANVFRQLSDPGDYLSEFPDNPFNDLNGIQIIPNDSSFPAEPDGTGGWIYKPSTKEIRINWPGTDSQGQTYYSY